MCGSHKCNSSLIFKSGGENQASYRTAVNRVPPSLRTLSTSTPDSATCCCHVFLSETSADQTYSFSYISLHRYVDKLVNKHTRPHFSQEVEVESFKIMLRVVT